MNFQNKQSTGELCTSLYGREKDSAVEFGGSWAKYVKNSGK
jgi:hypothetical protein